MTFGALPTARNFFTPWLEAPPEVWKLFLTLVLLQIIYLSFDLILSGKKTKTSRQFQSKFFQEPELPERGQRQNILIFVRFLNLTFLLLLLIPLISLLFD